MFSKSSLYANDALILEMLKFKISGAVSLLIAATIAVATTYTFLSTENLIFWFSLHIFIFFFRLLIAKKLQFTIVHKTGDRDKYLTLYTLVISLAGLLFNFIILGAFINDVPTANILIIGIIIIAFTAGSLSTLGTVFTLFISFMLTSIIPFVVLSIIFGDTLLHYFAFITLIYFSIHSIAGYRLFLTHKRTIELEDKFKTIFDKSSDGIAIIKNNRVIECNETIIKMFGYTYTMEEFLNIPISDFMPLTQVDSKSSKKKMFEMLQKAATTEISFEWKHKKNSGKEFWTEITLQPILINNEQIIHGVWKDISLRKKVEQEIIDLNAVLEIKVQKEVTKNRLKDQQMLHQSRLAQMGEMISMIAHQWRQPLNAISITSSNLQLKCMLEDMNKDIFEIELKNIDNYAQHLSKTINDFRGFFRNDKAKEKSTLRDIVKSTLSIVQTSIKNKNIEIITKFNSDVKIETYVNEVRQVVLNIVKNAEDALLEKKLKNPTITIEVFEEGDTQVLTIKDNAGGINEDIVAKIFDPYFSTKLDKDGSGLGLYMSKTIIEDHCGGKLSVENNEDGATFIIKILNLEE